MNHIITNEFLIEIYLTAVELEGIDDEFILMLKEEIIRRGLMTHTCLNNIRKGN